MEPSASQGRDLIPAPARLPSVDGWRAVSILIVLGNHSIYATGFPHSLNPVFNWLFDGNLGVRFFFVISGFLITWLLLGEWQLTGTIDLRKFYIRRCLRILPVYFAFLLVLAAMQYFLGVKQGGLSWLGCLTFTRNTFGTDGVSAHLWSLSVEEQFYLLWPGALWLLSRRHNLQTVLIVVAGLILLGPMARGASGTLFFPEYPTLNLPQSVFSRLDFFASVVAGRFFTAMDAIAFGCLGAILLGYRSTILASLLTARPRSTVAFAVVFIVLPHLLTRLVASPTIFLLQFGNSLQALGFTVLLLQSIITPNRAIFRPLNWSWVRYLGMLSYSIYIWQQLVWVAPKYCGLDRIWWLGCWVPLVFMMAWVSYHLIERPFFKLRTLYRPEPITME
jgi:peptidoglycan/LPS O-acetylase OafA/YrhL